MNDIAVQDATDPSSPWITLTEADESSGWESVELTDNGNGSYTIDWEPIAGYDPADYDADWNVKVDDTQIEDDLDIFITGT